MLLACLFTHLYITLPKCTCHVNTFNLVLGSWEYLLSFNFVKTIIKIRATKMYISIKLLVLFILERLVKDQRRMGYRLLVLLGL
jgi:hypothetical protein